MPRGGTTDMCSVKRVCAAIVLIFCFCLLRSFSAQSAQAQPPTITSQQATNTATSSTTEVSHAKSTRLPFQVTREDFRFSGPVRRVTEREFFYRTDASGRPVKEDQVSTKILEFSHSGFPLHITETWLPGNSNDLTYNGNGQLVEQRLYDGGVLTTVTTCVYNELGQRTKKINREPNGTLLFPRALNS